MGIIANDTFDRTDANPIGGNWATVTAEGAMQIVSNAATPASISVDSAARYTAGTWPADQYAQCPCTINGTTANTGPGPMVRSAAGAETYYRAVVSHNATSTALERCVAGTFTTLWSRAVTFNDGDMIRVEVFGSTLRVLINGIPVGADFVDGSPIVSGNPGIAFSSGSVVSASMASWEAGDLGGGSPIPLPPPLQLFEMVEWAAAQWGGAGTSQTDWTQTPTDDAGLTDTTILDRSSVVSDDTGLTDSASVQLLKLVTSSDDVGLTDTVTLARTQVASDTTGLTDTFTIARSSVVSDDTGLTDSSSLQLAKLVTASDDTGLTDAAAFTRTQVASDTTGLTDTTALARTTVVSDTTGLTDSATVQLVKAVAATDDAGLTDAATFARTLGPVDDTGLTDPTAFNRTTVLADTTGLIDAAIIELSEAFTRALVGIETSGGGTGTAIGYTTAGGTEPHTTAGGTETKSAAGGLEATGAQASGMVEA